MGVDGNGVSEAQRPSIGRQKPRNVHVCPVKNTRRSDFKGVLKKISHRRRSSFRKKFVAWIAFRIAVEKTLVPSNSPRTLYTREIEKPVTGYFFFFFSLRSQKKKTGINLLFRAALFIATCAGGYVYGDNVLPASVASKI